MLSEKYSNIPESNMMDPSAAANTFQDAFMSLLTTNGWDYSSAANKDLSVDR